MLGLADLGSQSSSSKITVQRGLGLLGAASSSKKIVDIKGNEKFEVHWSTNLSQAQNLTSPKFEKIIHVGNDIGENNS
ncbi:hypothetical protein IIB49_02855 [Patescibacteria group bacterium]|nr:hypothetical protein [Patescibacteria group bacterium]